MFSKAERKEDKRAKYKAEQEKWLKEIAKFQAQLRGIKMELEKLPLDEKRKKKLKVDQKEAQNELDRAKGQLDKYKAKLERLPPEKQLIPMDQLSPSTEHNVQIGMSGANSQPQSHSQFGQPQLQPGQSSLPQHYDGGQIMPLLAAYMAPSPPVAPSPPCSQPTLPLHMIPASPSPYLPTVQLSEVVSSNFACTEFHLQLHCLQCKQGCYQVVSRLSHSCDNLVYIVSEVKLHVQ